MHTYACNLKYSFVAPLYTPGIPACKAFNSLIRGRKKESISFGWLGPGMIPTSRTFSFLKRSSGGRLLMMMIRGQTWKGFRVLNSLTPSVWNERQRSLSCDKRPFSRSCERSLPFHMSVIIPECSNCAWHLVW